MNIETLEVAGIWPALYAMRNPLQSQSKSDSMHEYSSQGERIIVGRNDKELSLRLQAAGPEHCKHLRMIVVWADIYADLTFWKQFDTYRFGVEKVSTSTMHKLMARPLTKEDFSPVPSPSGEYWPVVLDDIIKELNDRIEKYKSCADPVQKKMIWQETVDLLPESYIQRRTYMLSYAAIRNIVRQRKGHKLPEWLCFINWAKTLPESWMIFDEEEI